MSSTKQFDTVVIGAGPGGYVCAIRLAQLGQKTAIIERENLGGVCLNVGCIPSKALIHAATHYWNLQNEGPEMGIQVTGASCDLGKLQKWKGGIVKKLTQGVGQLLKGNGVETIHGHAQFVDPTTLEVKTSVGSEKITAKNFVIATGSRVMEIPTFALNGKNVISSTEALELEQLPPRLIVIGGGFIGLEIGIAYAKLGSKVTVVEALPQVLATIDSELVSVVTRKMKKLGIQIFTETKALGIQERSPASSSVLHLDIAPKGKATQTLEAEVVLVSIGRRPNSDQLGLDKARVNLDDRGHIRVDGQGKTNVPGIYAIGDVSGAPQLAHRASMDGLIVAAAISGENAHKDYRTIPWAVFCDPEIAVCGLSEKEAKEQGIPYIVGKFPFAASGRALSTNSTDGMIKVLINSKDESIVGVHIVGPEASNLIGEAALAIEMGATVEDVVRTIHTHPTLPEAFPEAIETAFNKAIHIYKPPRRSR